MGEIYGSKPYGTFKYGAKEGVSLRWAIEIDWDNDGVFSGENEAVRCVAIETSRGREFFVTPGGGERGEPSGFEPFEVGVGKVRLRNDDGRYDTRNVSSPLYPNVKPGRLIKIRNKLGSTGEYNPIFAGRVENIQPLRKHGIDYVDINFKDGWRWLLDEQTAIDMQENVATDEAISQILSNVDWPSAWGTDLGSAADIIGFWWEDQRSAAAAINELTFSELGVFFISANGQASFKGRHSLDTSVLTLTEDLLLKDISVPQPWEVVRNKVMLYAHPRVSQAGVELWDIGGTLYIPAGDNKNVWAEFSYQDRAVPAMNLVTPQPTTDYTANTEQGGGGADLTADFTVTIVEASGQTAKLNILNGSTDDGYVTWLRLMGDAIDSPNTTLFIGDNSGSNQPRTFVLDTKHQQNLNTAINMADFLADYLSAVRDFPVATIQNRPTHQFAFDIADRITLTIDKKGIDADYRIGFIQHKSTDPNLQAILTTFKVEPFPDMSSYWQFTAEFGVTTKFAP